LRDAELFEHFQRPCVDRNPADARPRLRRLRERR
jgi:hypothetical protein